MYCGYFGCPNGCYANETGVDGAPNPHGACNGLGVCQCHAWYVGVDCGCRNCTLGRGVCVREHTRRDEGLAFGDRECARFPGEVPPL